MILNRKTTTRNAQPRRRKKITDAALILLVALMLSPLNALCQDSQQAVDLEDYGLTFKLLSGARPAGLAGAYTALGGDVHSLIYNPAGLANTRRIETSIGFLHDSFENTSTFFSIEEEASHSKTNLDYVSVAYPFPTYRGSLVGAFGIYRDFSSEMDLFFNGFNTNTQTLDSYFLQQSGSIFSYNFGFGFDMSPSLSAGASFFMLDGTVTGLSQLSYMYPGPLNQGDLSKIYIGDDFEFDLDGYGGRLGIQFQAHAMLNFGISLTTPIWINLTGDTLWNVIEYFENDTASIYDGASMVHDIDSRLPFKIDFGVGFRPNDLILLSLDLGYADWEQTTINKIQLNTSCPEGVPCKWVPVFREVINFRMGAEFSVPRIPLRLRGGYAYLPYPLKYLQADRLERNDLQSADIDAEHQLFSLGAGGLVSKILALDFAFVYATGERSIPTLEYKKASKSFLLSASYRF